MPDRSKVDFSWRARHLRVDTQVRLRWLAVAGQFAGVLFVRFALGFPLPLAACLATVAASACVNLALRFSFNRTDRMADGPATASLAFDMAQLGVLLFLTGGIENPFVILVLAPLMISAVSLPRNLVAVLLVLMIATVGFITLVHMPLPWPDGPRMELPRLYRAGVWVALGIGGTFVSLYAARVSEEARRLGDALAATEFAVVREQHLSQIDGLAAAAAHELGTPLATITLVVKEMARHPDRVTREDIDTLVGQTERCRAILGTLTSLGSDDGGIFDVMSLGVLLEQSVAPHRDFGVAVDVALSGTPPEPRCRRSPGLLYGLGNLIENAVDFAETKVTIRADWTEAETSISIADDGAGFAPDILAQAGEPYVSTRQGRSEENGGLGLGLFIAKTLLERSGATMRLENAAAPERGARIAITWPRAVFEAGVVQPEPFGRKHASFHGGVTDAPLHKGHEVRGKPMNDPSLGTVERSSSGSEDRSLLIVDDDAVFLQRLARAMEGHGYAVQTAASVKDGLDVVAKAPPAFAIIDMRLGDGNGLDVVSQLKARRPDARGVILTGYGNIATAVTAVKLGAFDYIAKPADADEIHNALVSTGESKPEPPDHPMSADRVRWEHIQRIYELCDRNVSETARRLSMHRRTLQRILAKRAPR